MHPHSAHYYELAYWLAAGRLVAGRGVDVAVPAANAKVEGALAVETPVGSPTGRLLLAPDGFFDGRVFDPDAIESYIDALRRADAAD